MKFVPTTKINVNNYLVQSEISSVCVQEFNINNYTTANKQSNNKLYLSRKTTHNRQQGSQEVILKRNRQQENLNKKNTIFKNWKNQNFCIATS